ncbi:MAG: hypothetical protein AB1898_11995 [Acidobacteriota bacterium]
MSQIEINGVNLPVDPALHTWQELLESLEQKHLGRGKVISTVHFDGHLIETFRDLEQLNRPLHSIGEVQVKAVPMEEMVGEALKEAETYLLSLQTSLAEVAETFRHQLIDQANSKLSQVLEGIKMFVALLQGIELQLTSQYQTGTTIVEQQLVEMRPTLESLVEAQTQKDWILVSDILEFELLTNLSAFERTIQVYRQTLGAV